MIKISSLFLYPSKVGGAENYFYNLLKGFKKLNKIDNINLVKNSNITFDENIMNEYRSEDVNVSVNRGFYDYLLTLFSSQKSQLIFSPNYITPIRFFKKVKLVTTIHDVQYLHFPQFFSWKKRVWLYISHLWTLKTADKVICISQSVKDDIVHFFGSKYETKLEVIYNPIDFSRFDKSKVINSVENKYILSVAASYPHKNLISLVRAFNKFNVINSEYKLVLAGQLANNLVGGNQEYQNDLNLEINKNENIIVTGYVSNEELSWLYKNCEFFVFTSLFEGFGMPPIEAMSLGKSVLTTKSASLKEVTQGLATYIDNPLNIDEIAGKLSFVVENLEALNTQARENKNKIIYEYDPINIATKYYNLFERVINEKTSN